MKKTPIQSPLVRPPNPCYLAFRARAGLSKVEDRLAHFDEALHAMRKGSQRRRLLDK